MKESKQDNVIIGWAGSEKASSCVSRTWNESTKLVRCRGHHTETKYLHYLSIPPARECFSCCLTSISVRIVSGWRLARRSDIVSRPPEKIRSTATAEPGEEHISVHAI